MNLLQPPNHSRFGELSFLLSSRSPGLTCLLFFGGFFFFRRPVRPECIHEVKLLTPPSIKNQKNTPALNLTNLSFKVIPWAELPKSLPSLFKISLWKLSLKDKVTGTRVGWVMTENGLEWCTPLAHVVSSWSSVFIILPLAINSYCKWMCWACAWSCSWLKACTNLLQSRLVLD